jgi:arylsulfatase A-like enzyme
MDKLLVVSLDTYRRDNLGKVVSGIPISPFMTSLKDNSVYYDNYIASCNWTIPSYASMFTGEPTVSHNFWGYRLYPGQPVDLIFDRLNEAEVRPSLLCCGVLAESDIFQYRSQRYSASTYDTRKLDGMINMVANRLKESDMVFFHTFLMHDYFHHYEYTSGQYGLKRRYDFIDEEQSQVMGQKMKLWREQHFPLTMEDLEIVERMYYNECLLVDDFMRRLVDVVLERYPGLEIIVNSDHGECFSQCGKKAFDGNWGLSENPLWHHSTGFCFEQFEVFAIRHNRRLGGGIVDHTLMDHEDFYQMMLGKFGLQDRGIGGKTRNLVSTSYAKVGFCGVHEKGDIYLFDRNRDFAFILKDNLHTNDVGEPVADSIVRHRELLKSRNRDISSYSEASEEVKARLKGFGYM